MQVKSYAAPPPGLTLPFLSHHLIEPSERKADDIVIGAFYTRNQDRALALNAVRAGFIHRFTGGDVAIDLRIRELSEIDARRLDMKMDMALMIDRKPGLDFVHPSGEAAEHAARLLLIFGLAKDILIQHHDGIGCNDRCLCPPLPQRYSLPSRRH